MFSQASVILLTGECTWQGDMSGMGDVHGRCTAADGMHPTGMHSCFDFTFYCPPTECRRQCFQWCKCLSVCLSTGGGLCTVAWPPLCTEPLVYSYLYRAQASLCTRTPRHVQSCSNWTSLQWTPDMFKLVYFTARTVGKQVVGIRLKCLLVRSLF